MIRKLLLLLVVVTLFANCTEDRTDQLSMILQEYEIEPQRKVFAADEVFQFTGEKGTEIRVNPDDLEAPSGKEIDSVEVRLLELTTLSELVRNNLQTVSDGRWLASGGSFKIDLYSNGELLRLKEGKSIEVTFPKIKEEEMQLFYGQRLEDGRMNWTVDTVLLRDKTYRGYITCSWFYDDVEKNKAYGIQEGYFIDSLAIDTLDNVTFEDFRIKANERMADTIFNRNDTLFAVNFMFKELPIPVMTEEQQRAIEVREKFYDAISLNKLGWINIDRFYPQITERARLELRKKFKNLDLRVYINDPATNTVVSVFPTAGNRELYSENIPVNKALVILAFGHDGEDFYAFKKPVEIENDQKLNIDLEKIDPEDIEKYF